MTLSCSCRLIGISRQAVYQAQKRGAKRLEELESLKRMVLSLRRKLPRLGTRKLYHLLKPQLQRAGIKIGRDGLFDYLRQHRLLIEPRRSYTKTTWSTHWLKKHPNLLSQQAIKRPEQVFVSDITYVESGQGIHYLSLVTDAFSRKIMGHQLSLEMKASDTVKALHNAMAQRVGSQPLIHHSDRGVQYCSSLYQTALKGYGVIPSMTDGYDCYQNALAERVNGILKQEFLQHRCQTFDELEVLVVESISAYNRLRPHLSLGMQTPEQVHKKASYCE